MPDVMRHAARRARLLTMALVLFGASAVDAAEFETPDPLRAFVGEQYALGSDYFIRGKDDTVLFRCILTQRDHGFEGVALSEQSIWGNRGGDWEVFRRSSSGTFVYAGTKRIENTACLESCQSSEYLASGRCTWKRAWKGR
jgi:hypothetical protein